MHNVSVGVGSWAWERGIDEGVDGHAQFSFHRLIFVIIFFDPSWLNQRAGPRAPVLGLILCSIGRIGIAISCDFEGK